MISIVIPIYNAEKYLRECLNSLKNQTYRDIEVLMVDDGSKDDSSRICDEFASTDNRFIAIHKENGGCSSARNLGIEKAKGEYIAFVDADDVLDWDMYEILLANLQRTESDVSACTYVNEYSSNFNAIKKHESIPETLVFNSNTASLDSMTGKENSIEGFVWNKVWKTDLIKGRTFRTDVAIVDDAMFTWEVISRINKSCFVNLPMYHYRIIQSSITRNSSIDKFFKALYGYEIMIRQAEKIAPVCLDGLCTDYIIWNLKTLEQRIFTEKFDAKTYEKVRVNLEAVKDYIPKCGFRHKTLAKAALKSWPNYRKKALFFWNLKQLYFKLKK